MNTINSNETVVINGTFLYNNSVECDIRIILSPISYGSGDYEDPPEIKNDIERETFYIEYGSTTERGCFNSRSNGYKTLEEAKNGAKETLGINSSLNWN